MDSWTYLLSDRDANLVEDLLEDPISLDLLLFFALCDEDNTGKRSLRVSLPTGMKDGALALTGVHRVVDGVRHHLLLHVHRRRLLLKVHHDLLDLRGDRTRVKGHSQYQRMRS